MFRDWWRPSSNRQGISDLTQLVKVCRLEFRGVSVEGTSPYASRAQHFVDLRPDGSILAAISDGVWSDLVIDSMQAELSRVATIDTASIRSAICSCSELVTTKWQSLSEDEHWDLGWSRIACGAVVFATKECSLCAWLGDTQIFITRNGHLVESNRPHTLFEECRKHGTTTVDERYKNVLIRSFAHDPVPDFMEWSLQAEDLIVLTNHGASRSLVVSAIEQKNLDLDGLAKSICENAHAAEPRIGHSTVVISAKAN